MFRFLYYKGYIEILDTDMLLELKKDINKDYKQGKLEPHQFQYLEEKLQLKLNNNKIICI
jgi:hypothetical protein